MNGSGDSQARGEAAPDLPMEVTAREAAHLLAGTEPPLVLDVREPAERMASRLPDDFFIPIGQIQASWQELPRDRRLLVYCHHGMRSLRVTHFLRQMGIPHAQSIRGGIEAWAVEVDPAVPRY